VSGCDGGSHELIIHTALAAATGAKTKETKVYPADPAAASAAKVYPGRGVVENKHSTDC
jgi:hypothetical protein